MSAVEASSPRSEPLQARSTLTRDKLLDAAIQCLVDVGFAGTTVTLVCEVAGLSRGAQIHHFRSKADLLIAATGRLATIRFREIREDAARLMARQEDHSIEERVRLAVDLIASTFSGPHFDAAMELWQASRTSPKLKEKLLAAERKQMREVDVLCQALLPAEVRSLAGYRTNITTIAYLLRGLALTRLLKNDPVETERVLALCCRELLSESAAPAGEHEGPRDSGLTSAAPVD